MRGEGDRRCDLSPAEVGHLPAGADAAGVIGARLWGVAQPPRQGSCQRPTWQAGSGRRFA
jgi:hypothetical protein